MATRNKVITIFLSNPCYIDRKLLITDSSWYRFATQMGLKGDTLNIVAPDLVDSTSSFDIKLKKEVKFKKVKHFFYNSFKGFYQHAIIHPVSFVKDYFRIVKLSEYILFRIPTPGFTLIALMSFLLKKPIIVFISGNIVGQSDSYLNSKGLMRVLMFLILKIRVKLHSIILRRCFYIFCVSKDVMELYDIECNEKVEILRTPIVSTQDIDFSKVRHLQPKPTELFKIIRVCWIQESKGLENLIDAVYKVSQSFKISLDIYGSAKNSVYGNQIKNLISELDMDEVIKLRGWVSNQDLQKMYNNFDLHIMSSKAEGMPRVCLESAAKGLPQLLTPVGGIPDFFTHLHDAYITEDCSSKEIQKGLEWFLDHRELIEDLVDNALSGVHKSSIESAATRVNGLFMQDI